MNDAPWFVPELHDVTPALANGLAEMLGVLDEPGRTSAAILVVPDWGGMAPIDADAEFAERVRALPGTKVLHGFTHLRGGRIWDTIWYGTPDEGEFARLHRPEALSRLRSAARQFEAALGAAPQWFCAPRWQTSEGAIDALSEIGIAHLMGRDECTLPGGVVAPVPAVWFDDGRRPWTRAAARPVRAARVRALLDARRPFRLALHPRDFEFRETRQEIVALLEALRSGGWEPRTLAALAGNHEVAA